MLSIVSCIKPRSSVADQIDILEKRIESIDAECVKAYAIRTEISYLNMEEKLRENEEKRCVPFTVEIDTYFAKSEKDGLECFSGDGFTINLYLFKYDKVHYYVAEKLFSDGRESQVATTKQHIDFNVRRKMFCGKYRDVETYVRPHKDVQLAHFQTCVKRLGKKLIVDHAPWKGTYDNLTSNK